jgi:hypothetical protein
MLTVARLRRTVRRGLVIGGLALLLTGGAASAAAPDGPRLALIKQTWKPPTTTVFTVGPRGNDPFRLAAAQELANHFGPLSWSADGAEVGFSEIREFWLAKAGGGGARRINAEGAEGPVFAPVGDTVAFTREELPDRATIWTIDLTTWEQRRLTPERAGLAYFASSFSPDGATLLATRFDDRLRGVAEPVAIDLATGAVTRLLRDGLQPIYSPDGSRIALLRKVGKRQLNDLFVLNPGTGALRRLTRTAPGYELFPSWDPSGMRIAFARFRGRHFEWANSIVQVNADGSCEAEILPRKRRVTYYGLAWQPGPGRGTGPIDC